MTTTIGQRELRNDNAKVIDAVVAGETFVVTRNGTPVAELRPVSHLRSTFVPRAALRTVAERGPSIDADQFRQDLDRSIDQSL